MSEINSGKINMAPKDEKAEKRTCPDLGFAQWPIGLNAQNDSKLQIGIRTNLNMINLDLKKVCCFTKVQVKDFFRSNKAWNSILRGFLDPKFHGEYESDKKWNFFYFHQIWWCQYINNMNFETWIWPLFFRNRMLYFKKHVMVQVGIVIVENKQKVQGKFSKYFILPPAGLEEGTSKPI